MVLENGLEAEPLEEAVEDGEDTDGGGVEGPACGACDPAGPERWRGWLPGACGFVIQGSSPDAFWPRWWVRASGLPAPPP